MKKIIVGILVLCCLAVCLTACGKNDSTVNNDSPNPSISDTNEQNVTSSKYFIKVNNKTINFPCKLKDFTDIGLTANSDDIQKVKTSTSDYEIVNLESCSATVIQAYVKPEDKESDKLTVIGFSMPVYVEGTGIEFCGLIKGKSTLDDILNKFGNPEIPEEIDRTYLVNTLSWQSGNLIISTEENKLSAVQYIGGQEK